MSEPIKTILDHYPDYEATIGIEVHVQLKTKSKLFCACPNEFGATPNTNICPVCCGYPGTLPVLNRKSVDFAIMAGLATNCTIRTRSTFARKHYMYPDLPKNFQITQDDKPICHDGFIFIELPDGSEKKVRLLRIHMEEDAGKNIHATETESFVDLNRAGTPLLEIVSQPDIASAYEAKTYLMRLRAIIQYLGISEANMEEGSFRADTNISVKKKTSNILGTRVELKNINSFKFISQAIEYEIERQIELIESGGKVAQETRAWDSKKQISIPMRNKEEAQDYRYFTEPDLPPIVISEEWQNKIRQHIPELPHDRFKRFQKEFGLSSYEANILVEQVEIASFFEAAAAQCKQPKILSNWILRDLLGYLHEHDLEITQCPITPEMFAEFINVIDQGIINSKVAQDVFECMLETGKYPSIIIQEKDLHQISSIDALEEIVRDVITKNPESIKKYHDGNSRLLGYLVGQAIKATKGKGNPQIINDLFKKYLD